MAHRWGSDLRINTLHTQDWCHAAWVLAIWIARLGRAAADEQGGEVLPPVRMKDKGDAEREKDVEGICPRGKTPRAPVFNVVDDGNTTQ